MNRHSRTVSILHKELVENTIPESVAHLEERLKPLSIGLAQKIPVLFKDTRLFRVRRITQIPHNIDEVGAPPSSYASLGRLNDRGHSVLYLADTPETALIEARVEPGEICCLTEWRVNAEKLALANGGIPSDLLKERFSVKIDGEIPEMPRQDPESEEILQLFQKIFTLAVEDDTDLYRWSIACGLANGFSHTCERTRCKVVNGNTEMGGRYPLSAIAYPSVRNKYKFLNYAFNDLGISNVSLKQIQWISHLKDGIFCSVDFADSWDSNGAVIWKNRPANLVLKPSQGAKITKVAENTWNYETSDGSIPWFE